MGKRYSVDINQCADDMLNRIITTVKAEIRKDSPRIETAIVQNINQDGTVDVFLPSDPNSIFTRIQNQSIYQDLQIGDGIELLLKNGRFSNCWIIGKHKSNYNTPMISHTSSSFDSVAQDPMGPPRPSAPTPLFRVEDKRLVISYE